MVLDVSTPAFYYPFIIAFTCMFLVVQLLIYFFRKEEEHDYNDLDEEEAELIKDEKFIQKGHDLRLKYMFAFLLSKSAMWAKAPYTFMLFSTYHKLSIGEIGMLYLLDAVVSLFAGPFLGFFADRFGRKLIAMFYPINTCISLLLRMSGNIPMAYLAQIVTGVTGGILATSFESWLNYEISAIYGNNKNYIQYFRKSIFQKIIFYDSVLSLAVTIFTAVIYVLLIFKKK
jgi:MFS family permease